MAAGHESSNWILPAESGLQRPEERRRSHRSGPSSKEGPGADPALMVARMAACSPTPTPFPRTDALGGCLRHGDRCDHRRCRRCAKLHASVSTSAPGGVRCSFRCPSSSSATAPRRTSATRSASSTGTRRSPIARGPSARIGWPTRWSTSGWSPATGSRSSPTTPTTCSRATTACSRRARSSIPINIRLTPHEIAYILEHAGSRVVFFHRDFTPLVEAIAPQLSTRPRFVVMEGERGGVATDEYEALLAGGSGGAAPPAGRRERHRGAVLHERHDRPAQGRRAQPSRSSTSTRSTPRSRSASARTTWSCTSCRCSTSTAGACRTS